MRYLISVIIIISLCAQPLAVWAETVDDLRQQINERQAQIQELEQQIAQYQKIIKSTESQGATLKQQISKMETQIKQLETEIKLTQTKILQSSLTIEGLASDIQTQSIELEKQKTALAQILRAIDEYDQENIFSLFMQNSTFSEFFNQIQYMVNLQGTVQAKLLEVKDLKAELETQKIEQETQKSLLEDFRLQLRGKGLALDSQKDEKQNLLVATKNQEKQYQAMVSDLQKKREEIEAEIYKIEEKLRQQIDPDSLPAPRPGLFVWPVKNKTVTQSFGCLLTAFARRSYPACNDGKGGFHNGIDIDTKIGDSVYAALDGTISGVGDLGRYAYGKWIAIKHENGLTTMYAHLSVQSVRVGQKVRAGEIIGYAGNTGYSTGSHLHFTVYATNTFSIEQRPYGPLPVGGAVNPINYL